MGALGITLRILKNLKPDPFCLFPTAAEAIEQRGLMIYNTNNAERALIYRATENIPTTVRTSLGGTAPELLIDPAYFNSLKPVSQFPVVPK